MFGLEGLLLRLADALPERAVDRDHALAEDRPQPVEILGVVVGVLHQNVLEVVDLAQQHDALILQVDRDHAAILLAQPLQDLHRIVLVEERRELEPNALLFAEPWACE